MTSVDRHAAADPPLARDPARFGGAGACRPRHSHDLRATPAAASPQDQLSQKQAQAAQLQAQIDANGNRISILDEQFNQTQLAIDEANQGIADTQSRLDAAAKRADALKGELASRAAALYVGAANGVPADLVGASDVSELSSRTKYGSAAADEDHGLIDDVTVAKEQLAGRPGRLREEPGRGGGQEGRPRRHPEPARRRAEQATGAARTEQG